MVVMKVLVFAATVATALMLASTAFANSLTCAHGNACNAATLGSGTSPGSGGTLPFTGFDLAGIAGIGVLLLASGFTLHRVSRRTRR
jgi:hypothetical protein